MEPLPAPATATTARRLARRAGATLVDALLTLSLIACTVAWIVASVRLADRHDSAALRSLREAEEGMGGAFFAVFLVVGGFVTSVAAVFAYAIIRRRRSAVVSYALVNAALGAMAIAFYLLLDPAWR